jgi:predicted GNAT family acetyltransferase
VPSAGDVRNNEAKSRFEIDVGDDVGFAEYRLLDDRIVFTHTIVPNAEEHRGYGSALAEAGLAYARHNGLSVVPRCRFFAAYIARHPEHQDLVRPDQTED